jgi:hypothetical protein
MKEKLLVGIAGRTSVRSELAEVIFKLPSIEIEMPALARVNSGLDAYLETK